MSTTNKRVVAYVPDDILQRLNAKCSESGAPAGEIIRRALDEFLPKPGAVHIGYRASSPDHAQRAVAAAKVLLSVRKPEGE